MEFVSMWAAMAAWFTPTVLFCIANLIVATIFLASYNTNKLHNHGDSFSPLTRVSSFIEQARSMNLRSYTAAAEESQQCPPSPSKAAAYGSSSRLAQSIHSSSDHGTPQESSIRSDMSRSERGSPRQSAGAAPSLFERVKSIKLSNFYSDNTSRTHSELISRSPGQPGGSPSFLVDRLKSFKISSVNKHRSSSSQPENVVMCSGDNIDQDHHVTQTKSLKTPAKKPVVEIKKTRSDIRIASDDEEDIDIQRPATTREMRKWNDDDEEVDAKADDFISRFKKQLNLQRVESLVRYNKRLNGRG